MRITRLHGAGRFIVGKVLALSDDGSLCPGKAPAATWFATEVHALIPGVRLQAWLDDEVAPKAA